MSSSNWDGHYKRFPVMTPTIFGQFPGFALMYRRGDVKEAPNVVFETSTLGDVYRFKGTKASGELNMD